MEGLGNLDFSDPLECIRLQESNTFGDFSSNAEHDITACIHDASRHPRIDLTFEGFLICHALGESNIRFG